MCCKICYIYFYFHLFFLLCSIFYLIDTELFTVPKHLEPNDKIFKTTQEVKARTILNDLFNIGIDLEDRKNKVVIHTLRHTFASHLAINGTPIFTIQKLMNHKDIKMTLRYAKLSPDSGREAILNLGI
ncbi:hypothetical protein CJ671_09950 [Aliarcobacter cryaerophilus]|uniref:Tyr recombinase domain-containing protein n=1 Tax=Aliarcobacter cryaerophilus TaxID=28198 RepID=A0A2S9SLN9_9BACT|nr:hypothetical protein CJ671_09950 [Aliarcobacter cryaerophilus]